MIRRGARIFLEFLAGLAAGAMILALVGWWWLSTGPITVTFLNPYIEDALSLRDSTVAVEIDDTVLVWAGWERAVDVRVTNLRVLDFERKVIATLPQVSLGFSLRAMMRGLLAPTYIEIQAPEVSVVRHSDGNYAASLASGAAGENQPGEDAVLSGLVTELLSTPDLTRSFGYLRRVGIVDADLTLRDHRLNRVWHAPSADITMVRNTAGIGADFVLELAQDGENSRIAGIAEFRRDTTEFLARLDFSDLDSAPFLTGIDIPPVQRLAAARYRVNGTVDLRAAADGTLRSVQFDVATETSEFNGMLSLDSEAYGYAARVSFENLPTAMATDAVPEIAEWVEADLAFSGTMELAGAVDGFIDTMTIDVTGGGGSVRVAKLLPDPVAVAGIRLKAIVTDDGDQIRVSEAVVDLTQGSLAMNAVATKHGADWSLRYGARATGVPTNDIRQYWPPAAAESARRWVLLNLTDGQVSDASLSLVARYSKPAEDGANEIGVTVESLHGGITVEGLSVDYYHPLPKITNGRADMTFTADQFDVAVRGGALRDLRVDSGRVLITDISGYDPKIAIDGTIRGPLQTALTVLDSKPLEFLSNIGLDAKAITGATAARIVLEFPLLNDLKVEQIAIAAGATLRDVAINRGPLGLAMRQGALELKVTGQGITAAGTASFAGVPVKIDWRENFGGTREFQRQVNVSGLLGNEARRVLGFSGLTFLDGEVPTDVRVTMPFDGRREVIVTADLKRGSLEFPFIHWRKPPGIPAMLTAFAVTPPGGDTVIETLKISAGDLRVNARAEMTDDARGLKLLEFRDLQFAGNSLTGRIGFRDGGGYDIALSGPRLDVEPFLQSDDEVDMRAAGEAIPLRIDVNIAEVHLGDGQILRDVRAVLDGTDADWRQVDVDSAIGGGDRLTMQYRPDGAGRSMTIATDNGGDALRALGWTRRVSSGKLRITGKQTAPGAPMAGVFSLREFKVSDAPALARILQVLSLTGIFSALNQTGLDFVALNGEFRYYGGVLEVSDTRAFGSSLGITTEGVIFTGSNVVRLDGTIVPAYTINQVLGKIPILGHILTGGKSEGVFAANYALSGSLENPEVSVNPLSALAPGFLRNLIGGNAKPIADKDVPSSAD
ncbi:MAG: AsmA-like C-terminal domain-containing protein [Alphaproteobacteria bacterium]